MNDGNPSKSQSSTPIPKPSTKPRAITRKSKAEREEYARKEAERAAERARLDAAAVPKPAAARGGRGGARGGKAVVNKSERTSSAMGSGVFGAGSAVRPERSRAAVDLGVSEALDGGGETQGKQILQDAGTANASGPVAVTDVEGTSAGKKAAGGRGKAGKLAVEEELVHVEEDDRDDQPRRDIERIWISSDDEDEDAVVSRKGKQRRSSRTPKPFAGLRPVRAARTAIEEHEDTKEKAEIKPNNTTADNAIIDVNSSDDMQIDDAPLPDTSAAGGPVLKHRRPSSPELTKKTLKKPSDSKTKPDPRALTETVEERAERLRLDEDIESLREAFLHKSDTDDTIDSKEEEVVFGHPDHDKDRMFLFQLPPLVPQLYDPAVRRVQQGGGAIELDGIQVKAEDAASASAPTTDQNKPTTEAQPTLFTADTPADARLPPGLVGKLKIHKSGKVTLDWGGTDMEVRYGTEVDFLQDVVCVETPGPEADESETMSRKEGQAYAMGQVRRKMVLVPDWGRLYA